ncbi:MAG: MBOAT family O-acyltransferase [Oscillospiraceae bacterium]
MVFSSLLFIFQFLPIALLLYYIAPKKSKNLVLFLVSLVFYSWGEVRYFPIMLATIIVNYICALGIERASSKKKTSQARRRAFLIIALVISFGFLFVFKYVDFFISNVNGLFNITIPLLKLTLPLGISFYTFQTLSYTIDVYRGTVKAEHSFVNTAAFVTLFPQLIAGPIVRYSDIQQELKSRTITPRMLEQGMEEFIIGLAKKVLIANNVGALWTEIEKMGFSSVSTPLAWLGALAFTLQIYFDFSGYSQMAIGLGHMMGFNFPPNFDNPYSSKSITEFWRRWHMTLSSWFKEYVYIPLGGNRKGYARQLFNMFVVWACTGFWHGASWNFVLWGLYYFVLLAIEKAGYLKFLDKHKAFAHVYTLIAVMLGWVLFAITDFSGLGIYFQRMFVPSLVSGGAATVGVGYYLRNYAVSLALGCFFSTDTSSFVYGVVREKRAVKIILMLLLFLVSVAYLVDSTYNPFLYFRF